MLVKVRLPHGAARRRIEHNCAPFLSALSGLVVLLAFSCLMLAMWRLTSDLNWTESFAISDGFLSHWQVWMALAIAFGAVGMRLNKYSHQARAAYASQPFRNHAAPVDPGAPVNAEEAGAEDLIGPRAG